MNYIPSNHRWMYDGCYSGRSGLKVSFVEGVDEFVMYACQQDSYHNDEGIRCPCVKCDCSKILEDRVVKVHLYKNGFKPNYWIWTDHGEDISHVYSHDDNSYMDASHSAGNVGQVEQFLLMQDMVCDALRQLETFELPNSSTMEEPLNDDTQRFYNLLGHQPLYEGASDSKLSISARLLACKSNWNVPDQCLEFISKMLLDVTPIKKNLPKNFYDANRLVSKLGLEAKRIDCCVDGCMLYYNNDGALTECKFCNKPRYRANVVGTSNTKLVPVKAMFYLPIIPRLQRMFASMQTAGQMTWHHDNRRSSGMLRHPSDGEAWKHFDRVHADFANEPQNVRLGLCSDGFNPYIQASSSPYSCWPIVITPYNLPPELCMTKPFMFLTCVVPGPFNPTVGIDVYLQPLIDDLNKLWDGVVTYDVSRRQNFMLKAALMWTINDFPAYGMLSGWGTHGRLACPYCMEDTKAFQLANGGKTSWFDYHRRFLPNDHAFRRNKNAFKKGEIETDDPPRILTPRQVWRSVRDLPKVTETGVPPPTLEGYGEWHHWTKKSIFWDLPYWKDNLLRHNLDVMHIEKKNFYNIFNTVMNVNGKTKDNEKARMDLPLYCRRRDLELMSDANGKLFKPKAIYTVTADQTKLVCQWIKELIMPDGYCSNLARCANVAKGIMHGMKSHDCHVFMECLLPIAFSSLPPHVLNPLIEISHFFKDLCCSTLMADDLSRMEQNIPLILCKLE